jgi:hypothetical protein
VTPERYETADGLPGVAWEQKVPTGETELTRRRELQWRAGVLLGLGVFGGMMGAALPFSWALSAALLAALLVAALDVVGSAAPGLSSSQEERQLEEEAKVARLLRTERRWAEVVLERETRTYQFVLMGGAHGARKPIHKVLLDSFAELDLGTDEEWFRDAASRELAQLAGTGSSWVIVVQTAEHGVLLLAHSGRDKAGMAELHRALTEAFIVSRPALRRRLDELVDGGPPARAAS